MGWLELFKGSTLAHGETLIDGSAKGQARTVDGPLDAEVMERHLAGEIRAGLVPVDDTGTSWCGAVDVDKHDGSGVDLPGLAALTRKMGWPGVVCRTRRGGAHIWFFFSEPIDTRLVVRFLELVAKAVKNFGEPVEIFPKQKLLTLGNKGSWIHLPYSGGAVTNTYAIGEETFQPLSPEEFLTLAQAVRMGQTDIQHWLNLPPTAAAIDLSKGPPCLEVMWEKGVAEGGRSNALVQFAVLVQRMGGDVLAELARFNVTAFARPMPKSALRDVASRVVRNSYGYMCSVAPQCEMCDRAECQRREFGIAAKMFTFDVEMFRGLTKIDFEGTPLYQLQVRNRVMDLDAEGIMKWSTVKAAVLKATNELLPNLKDNQWESILRPLLESTKIHAAPKGSSPDALVRDLIERFVAPVQERVRSGFRHQHSDVLFNMPVVLEDHHGLRVAFRPEDLLAQAKRRKVTLEPADAWIVAQKMGYEEDMVFAGGRNIEIWWKSTESTPAPEFTPAVGQEEF